jgi:3-isopropylmalate dehydratase small subunit
MRIEMNPDAYHDLTIADLLAQNVERNPDRIFLTFAGAHLTYAQVDAQAGALAAQLAGRGLGRGDRLVINLPNWPEFVVAFFAAAKLGAIAVPISPRRPAGEVAARLANCRPAAIVTYTASGRPAANGDFDHLEMMVQFRPSLPDLHTLIAVGLTESRADALPWVSEPGVWRESSGSCDDPAAILYTLGVSGEPRGAVLSHRNLVTAAATVATLIEATPDDVFLGGVPLSNAFGIAPTLLATAVAGARLALLGAYHPADALKLIAAEGVTVHHGVPTMFALELNHPSFATTDLSSLRTGIMSGAPCPPELVRRVQSEMGCDVLIAYGLTEASPGVTATRFTDGPVTRTETVGRPAPGVAVRIVDEAGEDLPFGEGGELLCRGPNVMLGYWDQPEETARRLDAGGWLHTGDLATQDANGPIRIVGRKDNIINRGGLKIYPGAVEMVLRTHPKVKEAAVVGLPDLIFGEISCACVVPLPALTPNPLSQSFGRGVAEGRGEGLTREELLAYCAARLADYEVPDRIVFFDMLPRRASGPVRRDYLREHVRIRGRAWVFGKNVDTDAIIPARHCNTADPKDLAKHCMEDADPNFVRQMRWGDLIVADTNFGCGSSREVAPLSIKAAGVSAVVAKSFARIFFRNAINIGLPIFECPEAVEGIAEGDEIEIDPPAGVLRNITHGREYTLTAFPDFLQRIIARGGLLGYVEERLAERQRETQTL